MVAMHMTSGRSVPTARSDGLWSITEGFVALCVTFVEDEVLHERVCPKAVNLRIRQSLGPLHRNQGMTHFASFKIVIAVAVLAGVAVPVDGQQSTGQQTVSPITEAEYQVYSVILDSLYREVASEAFLVVDSTVRGVGTFGDRDLLTEELKRFPGLPSGLVADFEARNAQPQMLQDRFQTRRAPVRLLGAAGRERIGNKSAESGEYRKELPAGGSVTFSRVGFTRDGRHALVQVRFDCGERCGGADIILLTRRNGCWVVEQARELLTM